MSILSLPREALVEVVGDLGLAQPFAILVPEEEADDSGVVDLWAKPQLREVRLANSAVAARIPWRPTLRLVPRQRCRAEAQRAIASPTVLSVLREAFLEEKEGLRAPRNRDLQAQLVALLWRHSPEPRRWG